MKVLMLVGMAGPDEVREPGQVVDVSDAEGARLIDAALAEAAPKHAARPSARRRQSVETATAPDVETPEG